MFKDTKEYLKHIYDECVFIISVSDDITYQEFFEDEVLKRAVVRSLEIIGEASKKLADEFRLQHNQIEWKNMAGMRDRLIHDYIGVNYTIVWDVMINKIPHIKTQVEDLLSNQS